MALGLADSPFWHLLARKAVACTALLAQTLLALVVRRGVGAGDVGEVPVGVLICRNDTVL